LQVDEIQRDIGMTLLFIPHVRVVLVLF